MYLTPSISRVLLPIRAEMTQACFGAFKIRWRKREKKVLNVSIYFYPLRVTLIFCILFSFFFLFFFQFMKY